MRDQEIAEKISAEIESKFNTKATIEQIDDEYFVRVCNKEIYDSDSFADWHLEANSKLFNEYKTTRVFIVSGITTMTPVPKNYSIKDRKPLPYLVDEIQDIFIEAAKREANKRLEGESK
jgi:hypothetical protein